MFCAELACLQHVVTLFVAVICAGFAWCLLCLNMNCWYTAYQNQTQALPLCCHLSCFVSFAVHAIQSGCQPVWCLRYKMTQAGNTMCQNFNYSCKQNATGLLSDSSSTIRIHADHFHLFFIAALACRDAQTAEGSC